MAGHAGPIRVLISARSGLEHAKQRPWAGGVFKSGDETVRVLHTVEVVLSADALVDRSSDLGSGLRNQIAITPVRR